MQERVLNAARAAYRETAATFPEGASDTVSSAVAEAQATGSRAAATRGSHRPNDKERSANTFETWRLDFQVPGPGAVHVSEFAEFQPAPSLTTGLVGVQSALLRREGYSRPVNKRDLGHRCTVCRRPFSNLGAGLVAESVGGPSQRFHAECWAKVRGRAPPELFGRRLAHHASNLLQSVEAEFVTSYADEWRRASLDRDSPYVTPRRPRDRSTRMDPLVSLITTEDEYGRRRVARGFSQRELEAAFQKWSCVAASDDDECAICWATLLQPLQLPCGHSFCGVCVEPWLKRCAVCPMCREDLHAPACAKQGSPLNDEVSWEGPKPPSSQMVSPVPPAPSPYSTGPRAGRKLLAVGSAAFGTRALEAAAPATQRSSRARFVHVRRVPFIEQYPSFRRGALPGRVLTMR